MKCRFWSLALIPVAIFTVLAGCESDPTDPGDDPGPIGSVSEADSIAASWMQALSDSLQNLPSDSDDVQLVRYDAIRSGMEAALATNSTAPTAHLGLALLDVIEINYDARLWALIDSLLTYEGVSGPPPTPPTGSGAQASRAGGLYLAAGSPILGNELAILATAPRELLRRSMAKTPSNVSIMEAQEILDTVVIPALSSAIGHLGAAEAGAGPNLDLNVEGDIHEIDLGEVFMFDAGLRLARAGFRMLTAYDLDLPGPNGNYDWIDDIDAALDEAYWTCSVVVEPDPANLPKVRVIQRSLFGADEAPADSILVSVLQHNYENRSAFLGLRGNQMAEAGIDLTTARSRIAQSVAFIRGETDSQVDDVIKILDLMNLDDDIATDPNKPRFAENFTTIEDVLDWIDTVMSGPYHVSEDGDFGPIEFDINLSAFLIGPPQNWRDVLPYFRFTPLQIVRQQRYLYTEPVTPGTEFCYMELCEYDPNAESICRSDVSEWGFEDEELVLGSFAEWTDASGNPIDLANFDNLPLFPDYTMSGLFPGADRTKWIEIKNAAGW